MKKIKIYCKNCLKPLSDITSQVDEKSLLLEEGESMLSEGSFIHLTNSEMNNLPKNTTLFMSIDSVNLKNCKDESLLVGCCGIGQFNKLNQICPKCKIEIAVMFTDCWMYHFVAFDTNRIIVKDFTDERNIKRIKL